MNERKPMHGTSKAPGSDRLRLGNFGYLFDLPTWTAQAWPDADEGDRQNRAENVANALGGLGGIMHDASDTSRNSTLPAAYTFFAQFVDHDITFDARSRLESDVLTRQEVEQLPNLRSASLDLDSVYGFGQDVSPYLYDREQPMILLVGSDENPNDVPRSANGTALIGDPRNDENIFLSQMHLLFLRFHNRLLIGRSFKEAQKEARYHYQAIVLYDFLKRICDPEVYNLVLRRILARDAAFFLLQPDAFDRLIMPVEFAAAAYRFGHSLVRSQYPVNENYPVIEIFDERFRTTGLSPVPPELTVDWRFLLDVAAYHPYANSKAIDHLMADELFRLPAPVVGPDARPQDFSLAFRNLLRGYVLGLPSGQSVAEELEEERGYSGMGLGQDLKFSKIPRWNRIDKALRNRLEEHTPLFFYLMREAGVHSQNTPQMGNRLGPVGSAILMEVFGAMLVHHDTFLRDESWDADPCLVDENVDENRDEQENANEDSPANEDRDEVENANGDSPANGASRPNRERVTLASLVRYVSSSSGKPCDSCKS